VDVSVEREADGGLLVKLATDEWEVNVRGSVDDFLKLAEIRSTNWNERGSLRAGESAGAPVFWASEGNQATLLIGNDDETWDVAITVPVPVVEQIGDEAVREHS
jgi:hypothetical protein